MPTITYDPTATCKSWETESLEINKDQWLEIKAKYSKSPAQQIREQLEREGMTVKQILADNYDHGASHLRPKNMLTEREALRRMVERAAEIVGEREPSGDKVFVMCYYQTSGKPYYCA